ncbi:MAG: acyl carrier protein [Clostridia bacterium]|nr:acyl carrier protein [Clostridia bacterium]MBQ6467377.1 acyl carrier protein [Clostridia bacterium]
MVQKGNQTYENCRKRIIDIAQRQLKTSTILNPNDTFLSQGIHSILFVKILIDVENEFGFKIDGDELLLNAFYCLDDIVSYVFGRINYDVTHE